MKTGLRTSIRFWDSLGVRVGVLLTVALLPLGLIAMLQAGQTAMEANRATETALLGRTAEAAASERALLLGTFGAAEGLSGSVMDVADDPAACSRLMAAFVRQSPVVSFAGFTSGDGIQRCLSAGDPLDVTAGSGFQRMNELRAPNVMSNSSGLRSEEPVIVLRWPVVRNGEYLGYIVLSIPHRKLDEARKFRLGRDVPDIVTFNEFGEILTLSDADATSHPGDEARILPRDVALSDLAGRGEQTFRARNAEGTERVFALMPVIPGQVYALGSWGMESELIPSRWTVAVAFLLPMAMWGASVAVAYFAVHRLVIRHIREMRGQMRRFALGQRDAPPEVLTEAPAEIQDVSQTFHNLARILIRDEAELAASLTEKTVLLKEVHHRVKNNLQLIASIMNMQVRRVHEPAARQVLRSVQERVMSLATIHRSLYQAERLSAVPADSLLGEIVGQMLVLGSGPGSNIEVKTDFAPVTLEPDQAVPLALLLTEALTNALKYIGRPPSGQPWIRLTLVEETDGSARLEVVNSCGPPLPGGHADTQAIGTGLGEQLMRAFVQQLDGEMDILQDQDSYTLRVGFRLLKAAGGNG